MLSFQTKLGLSKLQGKLSLAKLKNYIDSKNIMTSSSPFSPNGELKIAATSFEAESYNSIEEYIDKVMEYCQRAEEMNCNIIAFPQLMGLLPLGCLGAFDEILNIIFSNSSRQSVSRNDVINLSEVFDIIGEELFEFYYNLFSLLAERYKLCIHAGTTIVPTKAGLFNRGFFFDELGRCVCEQGKLNPGRTERSFNLLQSDCLDVFELPFGNIATIIGSDQYYFEIFKTARSIGADLIFCPCGPSFNFNDFKARRGAGMYSACCELVAIKSCLVGEIGGLCFSDKCGIYFPDGTSVLSSCFDKKDMVVATISKEKLSPAIPEIYIGDKNLRLYENSLSRFKDKETLA